MPHKHFSSFLVELSSDLPSAVINADTGEGLGIDTFSITMPIESSTNTEGELTVSLPRGRLATGFDLPLGQLKVNFVRGER